MAGHEKGAAEESRTIIFVDESGFYPLPGVVRTYAPAGQTPVLREWCTRDHLSAISGITPDGRLYAQVQDAAFKSKDALRFLKHLLRYIAGKLLVIWDGAPIHRSRVIKEFLTTSEGARVHLRQLPAYAPDLNPDEGIWSYLKQVALRNVCCPDLDDLWNRLRKAIVRLRRKPDKVSRCFAGAGL